MSKTKILLLMSTSILFMFACKRDNTQESSPCHTFKTTYLNLEPMYKTVLPYTGHETIKYLKNNTDTLTFIGQGEESGFECYDDNYLPVCPPDSKCSQYFRYRFIEKNGLDSIILQIYKQSNIPGTNGTFYEVYSFFSQNYEYFDLISKIGDSRGINYKDSMSINGYYYQKLTFVPFYNNYTDTTKYIYVNKKDGAVIFKNLNNVYTLIK